MEFSSEDLALFASGTEVFMAILDEEGVVKKANNKWYQKLQTKKKSFINHPILNFIHSSDKELFRESVEKLKSEKQLCHFMVRFVDEELKSYTLQFDLTYHNSMIYLVGFDITDHYKEHQTLQEMSAMAKVGAWYHDPVRDENFWSDECYRIHDLKVGDQINAEKALSFYVPEYRKQIDVLIKKLYEKGEPYDFSGEILTNDGERKWIRTKAQPVFHKGKLIFISGITADQTRLHENLRKLEYEKETRELALKGIKSGLFDYNVKNDKLFFSPEFKRMLGLPEKVNLISDAEFREWLHPDEKSLAEKAMSWGLKHTGDHYYNRYRLRHKDGSYRHYEIHGWKKRDGNGETVRMIGNLIDVHESVLIEQERIELLNSLKEIVNNGFMYSILLNVEGEILLADKKSLDVIRAEYAMDAQKETVRYVDVMPEFFKKGYMKAFAAAIDGKTIRKEVERPLLDGSMQWLDIMYRPIKDEDGEIVSVLTNGVDITERKKAELSTREAESKATELSELKSKVLYDLSHEIRTPLNGIMGVNELLLKSYSNDEQKKMLEAQRESSIRLLKTLTDMVILSDQSWMKESLKPVHVEANEIVKTVFDMYDHLARLRGLDYSIELPEKSPVIVVDKELFIASLGAIVNNALKYTDKGEVSIRCDQSLKKGVFSISITDTGSGIDSKDFGRIFEDEAEGKIGLYRKYEKSGIGLGTSKKYIESMRGTIQVISSLNKGSEFIIILPSEA